MCCYTGGTDDRQVQRGTDHLSRGGSRRNDHTTGRKDPTMMDSIASLWTSMFRPSQGGKTEAQITPDAKLTADKWA